MRLALLALVLIPDWSAAQMGCTLHSLEDLVANADLIVRGTVTHVDWRSENGQWVWLDVTFEAAETLKGPETLRPCFALKTLKGDRRWEQFIKSNQEQLWFLVSSDRVVEGEPPEVAQIRAQHDFKPTSEVPYIRLGPEVDAAKGFSSPPPPLFTMNFEILEGRQQILAATRAAIRAEPAKRSISYEIPIPRMLADRVGPSGDANTFVVPSDSRLEKLAHRLIDVPEVVLARPILPATATDEQRKLIEAGLKAGADSLRAEGARALRAFRSPENIERLKSLLDHPATIRRSETGEREFFVRKAAYDILRAWDVEVAEPLLIERRG